MVGQMYVEYMIPAAAPSSLSDRDGAWRQPDRHQLHRHARRPRRLGAIFRAPRLRRLRGRPGRARPRRVLVAAGVRAGAALAPQLHRAALRRAGALSSNGRRRICTRSGRAPASRAIPTSTSSTPRSFPRSSSFPSSRRSTATRWSRCSTRSGRRSCSLIRSPARSAGRWPTRVRTWSRRWSRSSRAARRCMTSRTSGAPDWFKDAERSKVSGLGRRADHLRSAAARGGAKLEFVRQDKADKPDLVRCWRQKEPARKLPNLKRIPVVIIMSRGVLSRPLRPLHRGLSDAGGRAQHAASASPTSACMATAT